MTCVTCSSSVRLVVGAGSKKMNLIILLSVLSKQKKSTCYHTNLISARDVTWGSAVGTVRPLSLTLWRPLLPCGYSYWAIKHPMPDRVKPSFVIFDIWALWCSDAHGRASECPDVKTYKWRLNPVWHRMIYSCTHMATVGVKGLTVVLDFVHRSFCRNLHVYCADYSSRCDFDRDDRCLTSPTKHLLFDWFYHRS